MTKDFNETQIKSTDMLTGNVLNFPEIYLAFDVETPNRKNDRISQIGLLLIRNGKIVEDYSSLINPETYFEKINTKITGLDSMKVSHSPTFDQYWASFRELFEKYIVIAHNAAFDLTVLYKTLVSYSIDLPKIKYICTFNEAMNNFPELKKFSIKVLSEHFNIPLQNHHNAGSDAKVCSLIFEKMKSLNLSFKPEEFKSSIKYSHTVNETETLHLPYIIPEESDLNGLRFVLTGVFTITSKSEITKFIESHGGKVTSSVSSVTKYLIVGTKPEPTWKNGGYGTKIEKAINLILKENKKINFIKEKDFVEKFIN